MEIQKEALSKFTKLCFLSGVLTALSFASLSVVYYFTTPEIERFTNFLKNDAVWNWFQFKFLRWDSFWLSIAFIVTTVAGSFVGLICAIFAKVLHDRAKKTLDSGLGA